MNAAPPQPPPANPPALLAFNGDWPTYEQQLYAVFLGDLVNGGVHFQGQPISCRRNPEANGRWALFWHLVQEGEVEDERTPDIRRCERLRWIRWVIENPTHPQIDQWMNTRAREKNCLLWYDESYLVILAKRSGYWLLKSAYCTEWEGRRRALRRERDA